MSDKTHILNGRPLTTRGLAETLTRINCDTAQDHPSHVIAPNRLAQDVRDGYLPPTDGETRGGDHVGRLWTPDEVRRARRLYYYRKRGIEGELLKVMLYFKDGWGWDEVKPICVAGLEKYIQAQGVAVRKQVRHPDRNLDEEKVERIIRKLRMDEEDFGKMAGELSMQPDTAKFVWGLGFQGRPLEGGSLNSVFRAWRRLNPMTSLKEKITAFLNEWLAELILSNSGITWDKMKEIVAQCGSEDADNTRKMFSQHLKYQRQIFARRKHADPQSFRSTNPVSCFGYHASDNGGLSLGEILRETPGRITPAQMLAGYFAQHIIATHFFSKVVPVALNEMKSSYTRVALTLLRTIRGQR